MLGSPEWPWDPRQACPEKMNCKRRVSFRFGWILGIPWIQGSPGLMDFRDRGIPRIPGFRESCYSHDSWDCRDSCDSRDPWIAGTLGFAILSWSSRTWEKRVQIDSRPWEKGMPKASIGPKELKVSQGSKNSCRGKRALGEKSFEQTVSFGTKELKGSVGTTTKEFKGPVSIMALSRSHANLDFPLVCCAPAYSLATRLNT